jgi:hypothetical protein
LTPAGLNTLADNDSVKFKQSIDGLIDDSLMIEQVDWLLMAAISSSSRLDD